METSNKKKLKETIVVDNSDDESFSDSDYNDKNKVIQSEDNSEFMKQCDLLLEKITKNYKEQRDDIRNLVKLHKKELKNARKKKAKITKDKTGFTKPTPVPENLANFLGLPKGTEMPRTELTGLLCKEFTKRNLYHKDDRRIIIPDDDVTKLFNLPKSAEKSTDPKDKNGLNFYNLQKHIAKCYNEQYNEKNNTNPIKIQDVKSNNKKKIVTN
ncbi:SWIB/MDM2 domain-containing protein [Fadolivirus algeromassiliense]|jgi:hypothetical protein|uniref:SWIB/MDM2 domain-containing protein n=1 Tax=Fadolivirus FV1/VV64 TaxID=3070911 RepID=A0A7D3R0W2_9VIRU|nr:SWIB/MDM2 domain-containing protein [Fadolivirus algeromassiliense]QKF94042.1 SWIB/MDM2 domain-containing protein [Fadolivirus FV1/VV64]